MTTRVAVVGSGDTAKVLIGLMRARGLDRPLWYGSGPLSPASPFREVIAGRLEYVLTGSDFERRTYGAGMASADLCLVSCPPHVAWPKIQGLMRAFERPPKNLVLLFAQGHVLLEAAAWFRSYPETTFLFSDRNLTNAKVSPDRGSLQVARLLDTIRLFSSTGTVPADVTAFFAALGIQTRRIANPLDVMMGMSNMLVHPAIWAVNHEAGRFREGKQMYRGLPNSLYLRYLDYHRLRTRMTRCLERRGCPLGASHHDRLNRTGWLVRLCAHLLPPTTMFYLHEGRRGTLPLEQTMTRATLEKHFERDVVHGVIYVDLLRRLCGLADEYPQRILAVFERENGDLFERHADAIATARSTFATFGDLTRAISAATAGAAGRWYMPLSGLRAEDLHPRSGRIVVVFVRHARGDHQGWFRRWLYFFDLMRDPPLDRSGIAACSSAQHRWIFGQDVQLVSSPLRRCQQTTRLLADRPFRTSAWAREISGSSEDKYDNRSEAFRWADRGHFRYESPEHARYRAARLLREIAGAWSEQPAHGTWVVVTHKWFLRSVRRHLRLPPVRDPDNLEGFAVEIDPATDVGTLARPERVSVLRLDRLMVKMAGYVLTAVLLVALVAAILGLAS